MGYEIQIDSMSRPLLFLMIDETDHRTGKSGLAPTVTIRKVGGSFASPAGAVTEVGNGLYEVAGNATDTDTLGPLALHAEAVGADDVDDIFQVVAYNPHDAAALGLTLFSGISSLANWLRIFLRSDPAEVTAKAEINAAGGAYNEATDSQQALRDHQFDPAIQAVDLNADQTSATVGAVAIVGALGTQAKAEVNAAADQALADANLFDPTIDPVIVGTMQNNVINAAAIAADAITAVKIQAGAITAAKLAADAIAAIVAAVGADTISELAIGAPPDLPTRKQIEALLYMQAKNEERQTNFEYRLKNASGIVVMKGDVSDDGVEAVRGKLAAP